MNHCSVLDCNKKVVSYTLCDMHRVRLRRYGDVNVVRVPRHGLSNEPEFNIWKAIKSRCLNPNHAAYSRYGGRGITICDSWKNNFINFYNDMGKRPSQKHSIDRINNDGNYEPGNCRWATFGEQALHTTRSTKTPGVKKFIYKKKVVWVATMNSAGKRVLYKACTTLEEALKARKEAEAKYLK